MKKENKSLELKKLTLAAWAKILLSQGMVDTPKYNKMIKLIDKLTV